ncbi:unnamed protein product [Closterium sp. NIES-53]
MTSIRASALASGYVSEPSRLKPGSCIPEPARNAVQRTTAFHVAIPRRIAYQSASGSNKVRNSSGLQLAAADWLLRDCADCLILRQSRGDLDGTAVPLAVAGAAESDRGAPAGDKDAGSRCSGFPGRGVIRAADSSSFRRSQRPWRARPRHRRNRVSRQCIPNSRDSPPRRDTGIASEEEWNISLQNAPLNESGLNEDGSSWYRESGEDVGENGYRCRWSIMGGRSSDGKRCVGGYGEGRPGRWEEVELGKGAGGMAGGDARGRGRERVPLPVEHHGEEEFRRKDLSYRSSYTCYPTPLSSPFPPFPPYSLPFHSPFSSPSLPPPPQHPPSGAEKSGRNAMGARWWEDMAKLDTDPPPLVSPPPPYSLILLFPPAGAEKSGRNAVGASWWETWQEVLRRDEWSGIARIERSAHKQAKSRTDAWTEKWWEKYNERGWTEKGAYKFGRHEGQSWWEKWGEQYDGRGAVLKWTDKWAEQDDNGSKWGDKWEERFTNGVGRRQGETWHLSPSSSRWSRTWGEEHYGDGKVHKYGRSTSGEVWDVVVEEPTYYEGTPHYGWAEATANSLQLLAIEPMERGGEA